MPFRPIPGATPSLQGHIDLLLLSAGSPATLYSLALTSRQCSGMGYNNFQRSWPFLCLFNVKFDRVAPSQPVGVCFVAKVVHMHEDIRISIVAPDEAIPLLMIKPLDVSFYSIVHFAPPERLCTCH